MSRRLPVAAGSLQAGRRTVDGDDYRYLFRALRLAVGDRLELFDGAGLRADATVVEVAASEAVLEVDPPTAATADAAVELIALVSLIKGERMDLCVQKLTELGVAAIVPVAAARSVVRLSPERAASRQRRLAAIAADAARQCGRATVPEIASVAELAPALAACEAELRLVLDEGDRSLGLAQAVADARPRAVAVLIGPEGGFESAEIAAAHAAGFVSVGLGPRILRAETAAIAAVAALQYALGDLGQAI